MRVLMLAVLCVLLLVAANETSLGTFTGTATGATYSLTQKSTRTHTVSAVITSGSLSDCTMRLEGSLDGTNFFSLSGDQTCTASFMFHVVNKPVSHVRAVVSAFTGTSTPTLVVRYLGME